MSNKITDQDIENAIVKLKPVFGIKPEIYLTVLYSFILLLVLFFILVYPGLKENGTIVYVETYPVGAVVYVDNVYKGSTPTKFFVDSGEREIKIEKKYFETILTKNSIDGRVFGTIFFPKKYKMNEILTLNKQEELLKDRFTQISSYALIEDYYDRYQMPPLISRTVNEYLSGTNNDNSKLLYDFLYSIRVNLGSPEMVHDYVEAISLINNINIADQGSFKVERTQPDFSIIFDYFADENNSQGLLLSIIKSYQSDKRENIIVSLGEIEGINSILGNLDYAYIDKEFSDKPAINGKTVVINNSRFVGFTSGTFLTGTKFPNNTKLLINNDFLASFPHIETVEEFYILEKEVTLRDYALFLNERTDWKIENIADLLSKNLVTKDYLAFQDFTDKGKPVTNISWHAAVAYCEWLETKLPLEMSGYTLKLPSEAQWEAAAKFDFSSNANYVFKESGAESSVSTDFSRIGNAGLYDISGNVWEWTDNWFFPTDSVNSLLGLDNIEYEGVEKAVRGGSWANSSNDINITTRGSQDPSWCTP
ncbi:MAG: SUMF1/EgtB/PvdO family nonheme iron enzyme, partial [Spirochaetia bacterium]|nr:SUMF1/EgtB/PvdO family nonheme iron enzyme [Spirochaetia bacterium]